MTNTTRVAVVGLGAVGSMALLALARRGVDVTGVDRWTPGHDEGGYGGQTRQLRLASHDAHSAQHIALAGESLRLWRRLEQESRQQLYVPTGQLAVGPADDHDIVTLTASLRSGELEHRLLDAGEVTRLYPQHILTDGEVGVYSVEAGVLRSNRAVDVAVEAATTAGATVRTGEVHAVEPVDDGVQVRIGDHDEMFDGVVVTLGPWVQRLYPDLRPTVVTRRILSTWFEPTQGSTFEAQSFPPGFRRSAAGHSFTFLPGVDEPSAKFIYWMPTRPVVEDPSAWDRTVDAADVESTRAALAATLRGVAAAPSRVQSYVEGFTPDRWPVVGKIADGVTVLTGFSGSGFAISPVMGEIAADLVLEGSTKHDITGMAPGRPEAARL